MKIKQLLFLTTALLTAIWGAQAQDTGLAAIQQWLRQQVQVTSQAKKDDAKTLAAKKKPAQTQSISVDRGSTTFVDQSSGSDLLSGALNLVPLGGSQDGSGTVSASLYSLYALGTRADPLRPTFYNGHSRLRTAFFTIGREDEQGQGGQNQNAAGTIYGVKFLPVNKRDASSIMRDSPEMDAIANVAADFAGALAGATERIATLLANRNGTPSGAARNAYLLTLTVQSLPGEIDKLGREDRAEIDTVVQKYAANDASIDAALEQLVTRLRRRYQVSLAFQTTQRKPQLNDDYRIAFILDRGFGKNLFLTVNASYEYLNSQKKGGDVRGGRAAIDLQWTLAQPPPRSMRSPFQLALSGEGLRKGNQWEYRAQLQLQIPIASGANLPVSFGYGNRTELLHEQEKDVYGKFGITFDVSKAIDALRGSR